MEASVSSLNQTTKCGVCSILCDKLCANCGKVSYCGRDHQKRHWKEHRPHCFPAVEHYNEGLGRYLVSTRVISPGEKIFEEKPLVSGPTSYYRDVNDGALESDNLRPICLGCCRLLNGYFKDWDEVCSDCSWPLCKQDCEKKSCHTDYECKVFQDAKLTPSKLFYLGNLKFDFEMVTVLRMLLIKKKDPLKWKTILGLESYSKIKKKNSDDVQDSAMTIMFLLQVCSLWDFCSTETDLTPPKLIHKILGVLRVNKVRLPPAPEVFCRCDVYGKFGKLTHCCVSNTFAISYPTDVNTLRAKIKIKKGTLLTEFYDVSSLNCMGIQERRDMLNLNYHFWCRCPRCTDPTEVGTYASAIKCKTQIKGSKCTGYYLPIIKESNIAYKHWQCNNSSCKSIKKYESQLGRIYNKLESEALAAKTFEEKFQIIQRNSGVTVHENHCLLMNLRHKTLAWIMEEFHFTPPSNSSHRQELAIIMQDHCEKLLPMAEKFFAGRSPERGLFLYLLVKSFEMNHELYPENASSHSLMKCWKMIKEAKSILAVLPTDNPAYSNYEELETKDQVLEEVFKKFTALRAAEINDGQK